MILGVSSSTEPVVMLLPFDEVAQDLTQEKNLVRIKKLLIYSCTQVWESDRHRLNQVDLLNLLQDLRAIAPTIEQLQSRLDVAVHSLSKAAEYTLVSNAIMSCVSKLYPERAPRTLTDEKVYRAIAQRLEQHGSGDRIKKLLILACQNTWITDPAQLAQVNLLELIRDLHSLTPSLITLQSALESRVNTLSKRIEYTLAADEISSAFQSLYPEAMTEARTQFTPERAIAPLPPPVLAEIRQSSSAPSPAPDLSNLFDLRLEIMQYANPYRAKIVLFSLLHQPFSKFSEHESIIKSQTLDDLLRMTLQTYKLSELEVQLLAIAKDLEDSEDCVQAAQVILEAVKPFYAHLSGCVGTMAEDATSFVESQAIAASSSVQRTDDGGAEVAIALSRSEPH